MESDSKKPFRISKVHLQRFENFTNTAVIAPRFIREPIDNYVSKIEEERAKIHEKMDRITAMYEVESEAAAYMLLFIFPFIPFIVFIQTITCIISLVDLSLLPFQALSFVVVVAIFADRVIKLLLTVAFPLFHPISAISLLIQSFLDFFDFTIHNIRCFIRALGVVILGKLWH